MSDANPLEPVWVDPERIQYYHSGGPKRLGQVASGDWDTPSERIEKNIVCGSIIAHFERGVDWDETPLYQEYCSRIANGESYYDRRFDTTDELDEYFERVDRLYEAISADGYLPQRELLERGNDSTGQSGDVNHSYLDEVAVNIYRDGTLAKRTSGNHRLAIARVHPQVDEIPVLVRVRHQKWQAIRDEIRAADTPAQLSSRARSNLDHPDLTGIVPEQWTEPKSTTEEH